MDNKLKFVWSPVTIVSGALKYLSSNIPEKNYFNTWLRTTILYQIHFLKLLHFFTGIGDLYEKRIV